MTVREAESLLKKALIENLLRRTIRDLLYSPATLKSSPKELKNLFARQWAFSLQKGGIVMKKVYPAIFEKDPVGFGIYFPDVEGAVTQAETIPEALEMASDALGIMLSDLIEKGYPLPEPSEINDLTINRETEFATLIPVELNDYLKDAKLDKKTIKIPHWLNVRATNEKINFSKTMADALEEKLNI